MKKLFSALALVLVLVLDAPAQPTPMWFTNASFNNGLTNDVTYNFTPKQGIAILNGIFYNLTNASLTTTNGVGSIPLIPGPYTAAIVGLPKSWTLNVPVMNGVATNAAACSTNLTIYSGIQSIVGGSGISISGPTGPTVTITATGGGGGGGFNAVVNTNDTQFTLSASTLFGPTNFDVGGIAMRVFTALSNYVNFVGGGATNFALGIGANNTNFTLTIGANETNNATVVSNGVVTFALTIGANSTNNATVVSNGVVTFALALGANSTNNATVVSNGLVSFANLIGANGTNNASIVSNGLVAFANVIGANGTNNGTVVSNGAVSFALTIGANSTNNATVVSNGVVTFALALGANSTNNATVVSNGVVTFALTIGANSTNNATVVSNGVVTFALALGANSTNNATAVSNGLVTFANLIGANGTNNASVVSNGLVAFANVIGANGTNNGTIVSNGAVSFALTIGANSTNNATVVSNGVVTFALALGANSTNNATVVSNGLVTFANLIGANGTNNATAVSNGLVTFANLIGLNGTNNATVVSNGVMAQVNLKVPIQTGAANNLTMTNAQSADTSAQNRTVVYNILLTSGHAGNWRLDFYSNGVFLASGIEVSSNLVQGIGGFTNLLGSLMAFQTDVTAATNNVITIVTNNYARSNMPVIAGPVTISQAGASALIMTDSFAGLSVTLNSGPPLATATLILTDQVNGVQFRVASLSSNSISATNVLSQTNTAQYLSTAPTTQTTATNLLGIDPWSYQDPNVIVVQSSSGPAWSMLGYFYTNSANTGAGCFTNPVLFSLGYGAILTNVGAGQWNFKTNNVLVTSVTGSVTNNTWSGSFSMTTVYGPTAGSIHFASGVPGSDIVGGITNNTTGNAGSASFVNGTITNNTTGNAASATLTTNALITTNAVTVSSLHGDFYVAPEGTNSNAGTSTNYPWGTLSYAAMHTTNGQTIHILGGTNYNEFFAPTNIVMPYGVSIDADPGSWIVLTNINKLAAINNAGFSPNGGAVYNNLGIIFYSPIANYGGAVFGYNTSWSTNLAIPVGLANPCWVNNLRLITASGIHFESTATSQFTIIFNNPFVCASSHAFLNKSGFATVYVYNPTFITTNWFPQQQYGTATKPNYTVDASALFGGATYISGGTITYSDTTLTNNLFGCALLAENLNQASNNVISGVTLIPSFTTNGDFDVCGFNSGAGVTNGMTLNNVCRNDSLPLTETNGGLAYSMLFRGGSTHSVNIPWAMTTISFPLTTVKWTNTLQFPISLNIDNTGVTGTALTKNGTTIKASPVPLSQTIDLLPGDYFSETYSGGTPAAYY